ncbi:MAG TPA: permease-like cell division protein FtsX [Thermoanaerobaculia bacterium]|nr:permease-like cell division protein FtsX [Thermoanaerobaculia bacterium]
MNSRYLFGEAWAIARSAPRHTAMAVLLIALAFYVPGLFALVSRNLARLASAAADPTAAILTLDPAADARAIAARVAGDARVARVTIVGSAAAFERFRKAYPDLGAALEDLEEAPFPPTIEVALKRSAPPSAARELARAARSWPGVDSAESEEEFARKFRDGVRILRGAGLFLGSLLAIAAILSVASAVRLALDLHRDEIDIMRRMGATEAAIRAPFWLHAFFEGLAGGALSVALLYATYRGAVSLLAREPHPVLSIFWVGFLDLPTALALPAVGAAAGLVGSLLSLSKRPKA